jgi:glycosyltransferase involved in cell wall biosynthesis
MKAEKRSVERRRPLVSVAMLGARMHFAVPGILANEGLLHTFYTDTYLGNKTLLQRMLELVPEGARPKLLRQLSLRSGERIPPGQVVSFDLLGLWYLLKRRRDLAPSERAMLFAKVNRLFGNRVVRKGFNGADIVWGFNGASLEIFQHARSRGIKCVLEQSIEPRRIELKLLAEESARWPGWQPNEYSQPAAASDPLAEREEAEWKLADRIVCGSQFVADGLAQQDLAVEKLSIVPYGVNTNYFTARNGHSARKELNVLFVGEIGLRKGIPYLLEALKSINRPKAIRAKLVGPVAVTAERLKDYSQWCEVVGRLSRSRIVEMYGWADVLVLPSICEGSATVTYEAMGCGLPVVATPNTGSLVRDGQDGFVVPIRDAAALRAKIELLCDDRALRSRMAMSATERAKEGSLGAYTRRLLETISFGSS